MRRWFYSKSEVALWRVILVFTMILWSSNYIVARSLLMDYSPVSMVVFRSVTGMAALVIFSLFTKKPFYKVRLKGKNWLWVLAAGFSGVLFTSFFFMMTVKFAGPSLAAVLTNLNPFFIVLLAALMGMEKLNVQRVAGILLGIAGLTLVVFRDSSWAELVASAQFEGVIYGLLAAFSISVFTLIGKKKLIHKLGGLNFTILSLIPSAFIALGVALIWDPGLVVIHNFVDVGKILYLGVLTTAVVWVLFAESMKHMHASQAATFKLLIPPSAAILSFLILDETLVWQFYVGMAGVLGGLYIVNK